MNSALMVLLLAAICVGWSVEPALASLPTFVRQWGEEGCEDGRFGSLRDVVWLPDGTLAVSDYHWCFRLQVFDTTGAWSNQIAPYFWTPTQMAVDPNGQWLFAYDLEHDEILRMTLAGEIVATIPAAGEDKLNGISDFTVDAAGRILVIKPTWEAVKAFDLDGNQIPGDSHHLAAPSAIAADPDGTVWVYSFGDMVQYDTDWTRLQSWDGPTGILADFAVAENGLLYCAISTEDRVAIYERDGTFVGSVGQSGSGPEEFSAPVAVAVSPTGWIAVADRNNFRIQLLRAEVTPVRSSTWGQIKTRY